MWDLVKIFQKPPDHDFFEQMDPFVKIWMFNNWVQDQKDKYELLKHHGMFLGSFINPEAVKKMMDQTTVTSTDEEFENTFKELVENNKLAELESNKPKRRRRKRK